MLKLNPRNLAKVSRRHLPHKMKVRFDATAPVLNREARHDEAEVWCQENFGSAALVRAKHLEPLVGFRYEGNWTRLGETFYFRSTTQATAFKLVWG